MFHFEGFRKVHSTKANSRVFGASGTRWSFENEEDYPSQTVVGQTLADQTLEKRVEPESFIRFVDSLIGERTEKKGILFF